MAKANVKKKIQFWGTGRRKKAIARVRLIPAGTGLQAYRTFAEELVPEKEEPEHEVQIISNAVAAAHTED